VRLAAGYGPRSWSSWPTDIVVPVWLSIGLSYIAFCVRPDQRETCHNNWPEQFEQPRRVKNFSVPISSQQAMQDDWRWGIWDGEIKAFDIEF